MQSFAKVTKLGNIGGRADYISNPERQEEIVVKSESVDWKPYQQFERDNQKTFAKNNEGREIIIALPNEWAKLSKDELSRRVQTIAEAAVGKKTDMQWAVHWNKTRTNLHVHVIFSERTRDLTPGKWDRDIYLTAEGKVARRAADRARDRSGNVLPPVHRKGELKGGFTAKEKKYAARGWVEEMKATTRATMERFGARFDERGLLHEYHEGKGSDAPAIRAKNEAIRANNALYKAYREAFPNLPSKTIRKFMIAAVKNGNVATFAKLPDGRLAHGELSPEQFRFVTQTPEQRLTTLKAAQHDVFRETFALHDDRPPFPANFGARQTAIKTALAKYDKAVEALDNHSSHVQEQLKRLHFWQGKQKRKLKESVEPLRADLRGASAQLQEIVGGEAGPLRDRAVVALQDQIVADRDAEGKYKPVGVKGDENALKTAQERFNDLCDLLPAEERKNALITLWEAHKTLPERGEARYKAITHLEDVVRGAFPDYKINERREPRQMSKDEWKAAIDKARAEQGTRETSERPRQHHRHSDHDDR